MRSVNFTHYNGEIVLEVLLALNVDGTEIVRQYYSCDGSMKMLETKYLMIMGQGWGKDYYTYWDKEKKLDYLAERIYKLEHK